MSKLKKIIKNECFIEFTFFISFNALILYLLFFIIKSFRAILKLMLSVFSSVICSLTPVIIGVILAYILMPLVELLASYIHFPDSDDVIKDCKSRKKERYLSIGISFLLIFAASCAVIFGFVYMIAGSINAIDINDIILQLDSRLHLWLDFLPGNFVYDRWNNIYKKAESLVLNISPSALTKGLLNVFLGVIASIYIIADKNFFIGVCRKLLHITLSQKTCAATMDIFHEVNIIISSFLRGIFIDSIIVSLLSASALSVINIDFAVFIGFLAGIFNIIPYFGPLLGMIPAFTAGVISGDLMKGIIAVIILVAIQQLDSNFIYPKVVGKSTGLRPLFVLAAVSIGGYFAGIIGMILSVPAAGIINLFIIRWAMKKEKPAVRQTFK